VTSGRLPCVKVNGTYEPVAESPASTDLILMMLLTLGGLKYVDALGTDPCQWRTEIDGIGPLTVVAVRSGDVIKARCVPGGARAGEGATARDVAKKPPPPPPPKASPKSPQPAPAAAPARAKPPSLSPMPPILSPVKAPSLAPLEAEPEPEPEPESTEPPTFASLQADVRRRGASDLHIVALRPALFRVAGELLPFGPTLEPALVEELLLPCIPPRLRESFERDGTCDFALEHPEHGRFRANVTRQRTGLKGCFRVIGREVPTLESLGLPLSIAQATEHHQGLIVLTGPTGHGKTSTLAALVDLLNTTTHHHIITVEDPVEYVHPPKHAMVSQREIGKHTKSFANALKASLREDPDVIVVGELRDTETVRMAIAASETGHLVLGTMNTPSAAKTIDRLIDLFPPGDQPQVRMTLAGGLRLIVSQRLVQSVDGSRVYAAAEILPGNMALWNLIREAKTYQIPSLQQRGKSLGIIRLDDSLGELVKAGKVTLEAAQAYAEAPEELANQVGRKGN
ncbi:MAG TPA: PilT/PilU family type 4a pilus ATPase, partial [Polyangiaceae bacterium]